MKNQQSQNFGNPIMGGGELGKKIFFVIFAVISLLLLTFFAREMQSLSLSLNLALTSAVIPT